MTEYLVHAYAPVAPGVYVMCKVCGLSLARHADQNIVALARMLELVLIKRADLLVKEKPL